MLESSYIFRGPPCPSWLGVTRLVGTAKDICVEFPRLGFDHQPDQHLINARIKLLNTWLMLESSYIEDHRVPVG